MRLTIEKQRLVQALETVRGRGKYLTPNGLKSESLGNCVKIKSYPLGHTDQTSRSGWLFSNGTNEMYIHHWVDGLPTEQEDVILDIDRVLKHLKNMEGELNIDIGDTCKIEDGVKEVVLPTMFLHPHSQEIANVYNGVKGMFFAELSVKQQFKGVDVISGFNIRGSQLRSVMTSCEVVGSGKYSFTIDSGGVIISSNDMVERFSQKVDVAFISSTGKSEICITAPIHSAFRDSEGVNILFNSNDTTPFIALSPHTLLLRASYLDGY